VHPTQRWPRRASYASALVFIVLLISRGARADDARPSGRTSSLSWIRLRGAESCVATQKLAQGVEARLGRRVFVAAPRADISVEGYVERTKQGYEATFSVRDSEGSLLGTRKLIEPGPSCDALTDALVLALAVMIDPETTDTTTANEPAREPPSAPSPQPPEAAPPPPAREIAPAPEPAPKPIRLPPWDFEMDASAALGVGILPGAALGMSVTAILQPPRFWALRIGGSFFPGSSIDLGNGARASISLVYGEAALCPLGRTIGRLRMMACAGAQVGALRGNGTGLVHDATDESVEVNVAATGQATLSLIKPLVAFASVTVLVPTMRRGITYVRADGSSEELFRPAAACGVGEIGLGVRFF
jgi:hypothetical protein